MSDTQDITPIDLEGLGSFDFTPSWAKSSPEEGLKRFRSNRYEKGDREEREDRSERKGFSRDSRKGGFGRPAPRANDGARNDKYPRKEFSRAPRAYEPPLDVEVRVLPEQKALGLMIRKIQGAFRAFPLKDIAYLFLDNPNSCQLRIQAKKDAKESPVIYQCKHCGVPSLDQDALIEHIVSDHLADFYDIDEIDCEPPKGNFNCVAKCGLSGVYIGPPNLHDYAAKISELRRTRYPNMSEEQYRSHIEMVRDPEAVEEWRKTAVKKTIYRLKSAKPAEGEDTRVALERNAAEAEFRRTILPTLLSQPKVLITTAAAGLKSPSRRLVWAMRDALQKERRFPASLFFALRGAFHNRKLVSFRVNDPRGPEFVTCVKPVALDSAHAIPVLTAIVKFVEQNPLVSIKDLVPKIIDGDESMREEVLKNLSLLLEKGHLVAYFDEQLAVPADHPVYKRLPKAKGVQTEVTAESPAEAEKPVAEVAAETVKEESVAPVAEESVTAEVPVETVSENEAE